MHYPSLKPNSASTGVTEPTVTAGEVTPGGVIPIPGSDVDTLAWNEAVGELEDAPISVVVARAPTAPTRRIPVATPRVVESFLYECIGNKHSFSQILSAGRGAWL